MQLALGKLGTPLVGALVRGWRLLHFSAIALATALSPSVYDRAQRRRTARQIWLTSWQVLPWFSGLSALISLVLIRVVIVTAASYGLSKYALEMLVRVLVIELIPLAAALFVALRAAAAEGGAQRALGSGDDSLEAWSRSALATVPQVTAAAFAVWLLAAVSSFIALPLAYVVVYGFSPWGLGTYTRTVGQVFAPAVTFSFVLKTLLFSWAVALIPAAAGRLPLPRGRTPGAPAGMVQLFVVLMLIEAASLSLKYL